MVLPLRCLLPFSFPLPFLPVMLKLPASSSRLCLPVFMLAVLLFALMLFQPLVPLLQNSGVRRLRIRGSPQLCGVPDDARLLCLAVVVALFIDGERRFVPEAAMMLLLVAVVVIVAILWLERPGGGGSLECSEGA